MLLFYLFYVNLLLVSADEAKHNGQCDLNTGVCEDEGDVQIRDLDRKKLLFYDVNPPEGFNLRRDVYMRFAILLAEAQKRGEKLDWQLVLPPWGYLFHWRSESYSGNAKPWSKFFNVTSLGLYAPVIELHDIMQNSGRYGYKIDSLYILQNYDDPFKNGDFRDKWNVLGPCEYEGYYWGYHNITAKRVICVQFQGSIEQLWEIIERRPKDRKVMFSHGEIPLHSSYGTKSFWDCRKSMQFNSALIEEANSYIVKKFNCTKTKCSNFLSIHWRLQDFYRADRSTSSKRTAEQIDQTVRNKLLDIQDVFIASDGTHMELKSLKAELKMLGYKSYTYVPEVTVYTDGQMAIIEQIICSRSAYFIGTHESTFTYRIQEEREILGFNSDTSFNSLCPDVGECEKPARWTIVH